MEIPKNKYNIGKASGYFQRFFELLRYLRTQEECYEYLEKEYEEEYKKRRYANFISFKRGKTYHYNVGSY